MASTSGYDIADIKFRIQKNVVVTPDEFIALMDDDHEAMFDFMVMNNPANINHTLKYNLGLQLPFKPDMKQIIAQLDLLIKKQDKDHLQMIYDQFRYNPDATNFSGNKEMALQLQNKFPNWFKQ